jgi:hypothetical protein
MLLNEDASRKILGYNVQIAENDVIRLFSQVLRPFVDEIVQ